MTSSELLHWLPLDAHLPFHPLKSQASPTMKQELQEPQVDPVMMMVLMGAAI
jgi:hypothetical protein